MTAEEREQVVELLLLAASLDEGGGGRCWPPTLCEAERQLGYGSGSMLEPSVARTIAVEAVTAANGGVPIGLSSNRAQVMRTAAQRVEEGTWP